MGLCGGLGRGRGGLPTTPWASVFPSLRRVEPLCLTPLWPRRPNLGFDQEELECVRVGAGPTSRAPVPRSRLSPHGWPPSVRCGGGRVAFGPSRKKVAASLPPLPAARRWSGGPRPPARRAPLSPGTLMGR